MTSTRSSSSRSSARGTGCSTSPATRRSLSPARTTRARATPTRTSRHRPPFDGAGRVTVSESSSVIRDIIGRDIGSIAALFLLIAIAAGVAGFLIATALSAPFQKLAVAAAALGRGRFDLDLPDTRIPEARAIADALRSSALALEDRVHRERAFAEHTSHVLRTPLTGIRLELEDLSLRDDLPPDAHETVMRMPGAGRGGVGGRGRAGRDHPPRQPRRRRRGAALRPVDAAGPAVGRPARLAQPDAHRGRRGRPDADLHSGPDRARHRPAARRRRTPRHRCRPDRLQRGARRTPADQRALRRRTLRAQGGARRPSTG